jgi:hypothetical protein
VTRQAAELRRQSPAAPRAAVAVTLARARRECAQVPRSKPVRSSRPKHRRASPRSAHEAFARNARAPSRRAQRREPHRRAWQDGRAAQASHRRAPRSAGRQPRAALRIRPAFAARPRSTVRRARRQVPHPSRTLRRKRSQERARSPACDPAYAGGKRLPARATPSLARFPRVLSRSRVRRRPTEPSIPDIRAALRARASSAPKVLPRPTAAGELNAARARLPLPCAPKNKAAAAQSVTARST